MRKKVLFDTSLSEKNIEHRDTLLNILSEYCEPQNASLLEVGSGNGKYGTLLGPFVRKYRGIDIDKEYVQIAQRERPQEGDISYTLGDMHAIPYTEQFDIILYARSLHFTDNHKKAFEEAARVLKPEGILMIIEPAQKRTGWGATFLNFGHKDYDAKQCDTKLAQIQATEDWIQRQDFFEIAFHKTLGKNNQKIYVLRRP